MRKVIIFLAFVAIGFAASYAISGWQFNSGESHLPNYAFENGLLTESVKKDGVQYNIPPEQIYEAGVNAENTPAINDPKFVSVSEADVFLADEVRGLAVEIEGVNRFYSYQILNWHTIVNDQIGSQKIAVTMCPFCRSAVVYDRIQNGNELKFELAGSIYNNNLLLADTDSDSLWMQARGEAVSGELIGSKLTKVPSEVVNWASWRENNPDGEVLSNETGSVRDYTRHPLGNYDEAKLLYFPMNYLSEIAAPKWVVQGIDVDGAKTVFANEYMKGFGVASTQVAEKDIVGFYDFANNKTNVFNATVEDRVLTFDYDFDEEVLTDNETGSVWSSDGVAIEGELEGATLTKIDSTEMFWMCWSGMYPDSEMVGVEVQELNGEENIS